MSSSIRRFRKFVLGFTTIALVLGSLSSTHLVVAATNACDEVLPRLLQAVVMIQGKTHAGTGFLLKDGSVVTNSHVIEGECEAGVCKNLEFLTAERIGQFARRRVKTGVISAEVDAKLVDLAILRPKVPLLGAATRGLSFGDATQVGDVICTIGFPHAERLRLEQGTVQYEDRIRITTTARGLHGVSGSPIVNLRGSLVGIVNESSTLAGGWVGLLFDMPFELSGVQATILSTLKDTRDAQMLLSQARIMNEYFSERVARWGREDTPRFVDTVWEANQLEAFADDLKRYRVKIGNLAPLNSYAGDPFLLVHTLIEKYPSLDTELDLESEKLFLTYTVGMDPLLTAWKARLLSKRLGQLPRPEAHKVALRNLVLGGEARTPTPQ